MLVDSHCHLTDSRFDPDRDDVISRALDEGLDAIVTIGSDAGDSRLAVEVARSHDGVWASVGIHPHVAEETPAGHLEEIRELAGAPEVVAIGETGLDYYYENSPRARQREWLALQIELAAELDLPLVVHCRSADEDMRGVLGGLPPGVTGVLHCFSGGPELMEAGLEAGWYVSFAGMVTFRKFEDGGLVRAVPEDRILVETDAPYLTPVPYRGKRNEPARVLQVSRRVAELRGEDPDEFGERSARNAARLFGLDLS